jgi:hypothetical protein
VRGIILAALMLIGALGLSERAAACSPYPYDYWSFNQERTEPILSVLTRRSTRIYVGSPEVRPTDYIFMFDLGDEKQFSTLKATIRPDYALKGDLPDGPVPLTDFYINIVSRDKAPLGSILDPETFPALSKDAWRQLMRQQEELAQVRHIDLRFWDIPEPGLPGVSHLDLMTSCGPDDALVVHPNLRYVVFEEDGEISHLEPILHDTDAFLIELRAQLKQPSRPRRFTVSAHAFVESMSGLAFLKIDTCPEGDPKDTHWIGRAFYTVQEHRPARPTAEQEEGIDFYFAILLGEWLARVGCRPGFEVMALYRDTNEFLNTTDRFAFGIRKPGDPPVENGNERYSGLFEAQRWAWRFAPLVNGEYDLAQIPTQLRIAPQATISRVSAESIFAKRKAPKREYRDFNWIRHPNSLVRSK